MAPAKQSKLAFSTKSNSSNGTPTSIAPRRDDDEVMKGEGSDVEEVVKKEVVKEEAVKKGNAGIFLQQLSAEG